MAIQEAYNVVFDKNGNVKACGREACKRLIDLCKKQWKGVDFGNSETGYMNIENIKAYVEDR